GEFGFRLPALRRDEQRIARIFAIFAKLGLSEKVEEADLAHAPAQLQAEVPAFRRMPAERDAAFGPEELACRLVVVDAVEVRNFGPAGDLEVETSGKRAA